MTALHVHGAVDAAGQPLSFTIEQPRRRARPIPIPA